MAFAFLLVAFFFSLHTPLFTPRIIDFFVFFIACFPPWLSG